MTRNQATNLRGNRHSQPDRGVFSTLAGDQFIGLLVAFLKRERVSRHRLQENGRTAAFGRTISGSSGLLSPVNFQGL